MNIFTICRKELNTYFRSPIAYGVMFFFALIAGYFFSFATAVFRPPGPAIGHDAGPVAAHGRE